MKEQIRPPKQERSRQTLARLIEGTLETLEKHGLDGTTIPRIAAAAKVAPASVYRRFTDKEALFRATFVDALERSNALNIAAVPQLLEGHTLDWVAGALARSIIAQYRARPGLMRALIRFTEKDTDQEFRQRMMSLVADNARMIVDFLVDRFRGEIAHRDPRRALTFAILVVANVAETHTLDDFSLLNAMLPLSDEELQFELKHLFLDYLTAPSNRN